MMAFRATKLLLVTLIVMIVLLPLGTVSAIPPVRSVEEFYYEGEVVTECDGGFTIFVDSDYRITSTEHHDKDGNLKVIREHWVITNGQMYSSLHPEIRLPEGPDHVRFAIDPETGISALSGLALHFNVPGYGIVAIDAGRVILDPDWNVLWERGPHMFFEDELEPLCSFFAAAG